MFLITLVQGFGCRRLEILNGKVLCLPTGSAITGDYIGQICSVIKFVSDNCKMILRRIGSVAFSTANDN
jgi:hypothetical protein